MSETVSSLNNPADVETRNLRPLALLTSLLLALVGSLVLPSPAQASGSCYLTAEAPYKHTRITGQKQVYGKGTFRCDGSRVALSVEVKIAKWHEGSKQWYWVDGLESTVTENSYTKGRHTWAFLCSSNGWGSGGSGYYQTYVMGTWMEYGGGPGRLAGWKVSGYRYLSC